MSVPHIHIFPPDPDNYWDYLWDNAGIVRYTQDCKKMSESQRKAWIQSKSCDSSDSQLWLSYVSSKAIDSRE